MQPQSSPHSDTRVKPLVALRAIRALFKNKEDTGQVFKVVEALKGDSILRNFERFKASELGASVLAERRLLIDTLCNKEYLAGLPEDSYGKAYQNFLDTENLTAEGLVSASEEAPRWGSREADMALFTSRLRDSHDLHHVLTGYGRNPVGELCTLTFGYPHTRNRGIGVLVLIGMFKIKKDMRDVPVFKAVWQAYRNGKKAAWLPGVDWEAMLPLPLEEVRRQLNILSPTEYQKVEKCLKCKEADYQSQQGGMPQTA